MDGVRTGGTKEQAQNAANSTFSSASTQNSGPTAPTISKRKSIRPGLQLDQGRQTVKGYSVTEDQLETLSVFGRGATFFFTLAAGLLGFAINLKSALDLAPDAPKQAFSFWTGINYSALAAAILTGIIAIYLAYSRGSKLRAIKNNTEFNGQ
jgi:hypothetical protein